MKKNLFLLILISFLLVSCNKDEEKDQDLNDDEIVIQDEEENIDVENETDDQRTNENESEEEIDENPSSETENESESNEETDSTDSTESSEGGQADTLNENDAAEIVENFQERLFVDVDDDLKVVAFSSKEEIVEHIAEYASVELAGDFVDNFYLEEDGEVFIVPQAIPPFLNVYDSFNLEKQSEMLYLVSQESGSELHGEYTLYLLIEYIDDRFIVVDYYTE